MPPTLLTRLSASFVSVGLQNYPVKPVLIAISKDYSGAVSSNPAYAERQDINFPNVNACEDGIRYQVFFPMCWDGVNLDSADHKSHMAYPVDNYNSGTCPSSHPVHLVGLFFEMLIPVSGYNYWGQGAYVLASGDPTGLAFHGDFQNGKQIVTYGSKCVAHFLFVRLGC